MPYSYQRRRRRRKPIPYDDVTLPSGTTIHWSDTYTNGNGKLAVSVTCAQGHRRELTASYARQARFKGFCPECARAAAQEAAQQRREAKRAAASSAANPAGCGTLALGVVAAGVVVMWLLV